MSKSIQGEVAGCPCDEFIHPGPLEIPPGLSTLPRQVATFPEFRKAMIRAIQHKPPLRHWRAQKGDFGIMLLELWAYICDVVSFYDQVLAQEMYLSTAQERISVSQLVQLLGYIPRPAIAAQVQLVALAQGRQAVTLPKGMAFRSGALDSSPPQVFELSNNHIIHPFKNKWHVKPPGHIEVGEDNPQTLTLSTSRGINEGTILFLEAEGHLNLNQGLVANDVERVIGIDDEIYQSVTFKTQANLPKNIQVSNLKVYTPTATASLWLVDKFDATSGALLNPSIVTEGGKTTLILDNTYNLRPGQPILLDRSGAFRFFEILEVNQVMREPNPVNQASINGFSYDIPSISVPVTAIVLDTTINDPQRVGSEDRTGAWENDHRSEVLIHYEMNKVGVVVNLPKIYLTSSDELTFQQKLDGSIEESGVHSLLLEDVNLKGTVVSGQYNVTANQFRSNEGAEWGPLQSPVTAYGNTVWAIRGEKVTGEFLGVGDGTRLQQFSLKKHPLTYILAPNARNGVANTLSIYVDGIRWKEVDNFLYVNDGDQVYMVRQNEAGKTSITFGAPIPTGSQIVADYRFGAGEMSPPAGSINQIVNPIAGLQSVRNPVAAFGGADAESANQMRNHAPRTAILSDRAVSILDFRAVALSVPGVKNVQSMWDWDHTKNRALVKVWYIGSPSIETTVEQQLQGVADDNIHVNVVRSEPTEIPLSINLRVDENFLKSSVIDSVFDALLHAPDGILRNENQQIGVPFYRSMLFTAILQIPGVRTVSSIYWRGHPFSTFAKAPAKGGYFDFEKGVSIKVVESTE